MRDARLWSHTDHAISRTVAKVGPIVTSAAVLFAVSIEVFGTAKMIVLKILGVGTALAVLTNAIRVCGLALPAVMVLLGRSAWWLPAVLDRLYRRIRLSEDDDAGIRLDTKASVGG